MWRLVKTERDHGAIAVIYALSFMLLLGFVGLSIDVGAAFAKRQEAQNAADAAAIAVAFQCLESKTLINCPGDYDTARNISLLNERRDDTAKVLDGDIDYDFPSPNHVTVTVTAEHDAWLLPAATSLGSLTVKRSATVNYGSPVHGTVTLPVAGSECVFPDLPPEPDASIPIELWLPQNATQAETADECNPSFPAGGFGWLAGEDCTAEIGIGGTVPSAPGTAPPSDCGDLGKAYFKDLADANTEVLIPLFELSYDSGGNAIYVVTRFAVFELTGMHTQVGYFDDSDIAKRCKNPPAWVPTNWKYGNTTCLRGNLLGYKDDPGDFDLGGPITEITFTRLVG